MKLVVRLFLTLLLAAAFLAVVTVLAFAIGGFVFGFSGHPAGPDLPAFVYTVFAVAAPLACLAAAAWLVFRRRPAG